MKINICTAIQLIKPNAQVSVLGDDISTLVWHDGNPTNITNEQILTKQAELQALEDNKLVLEEQRKQSAISKLKAIGLTDEEINSLLGK